MSAAHIARFCFLAFTAIATALAWIAVLGVLFVAPWPSKLLALGLLLFALMFSGFLAFVWDSRRVWD